MITVKKGDITRVECDAIVNPANSRGEMGGGVALSIKAAGGREIEDEAVVKSPIPVGSAIATTAGRLKCKYVIHAPTMARPAERTSAENVRKAVRAALKTASSLGAKRIAFPGMGTGVGGVDHDTAARVMIDEMKNSSDMDIVLVGYTDEMAEAFRRNLKDQSND